MQSGWLGFGDRVELSMKLRLTQSTPYSFPKGNSLVLLSWNLFKLVLLLPGGIALSWNLFKLVLFLPGGIALSWIAQTGKSNIWETSSTGMENSSNSFHPIFFLIWSTHSWSTSFFRPSKCRIYVTSFPVSYTEVTVSFGLKQVVSLSLRTFIRGSIGQQKNKEITRPKLRPLSSS